MIRMFLIETCYGYASFSPFDPVNFITFHLLVILSPIEVSDFDRSEVTLHFDYQEDLMSIFRSCRFYFGAKVVVADTGRASGAPR